jgi:putative radical SAM enzyme (TIGR03279 family)
MTRTGVPAGRAEPRPPVGLITGVLPGSAAAHIGIRPGDELLALNGHPCEDVIDVQYHGAEPWLAFRIRRGGVEQMLKGPREYDQPLGLEFQHPTFDIDIRRCNNLCEFCFVLQMAPRMRRTLYIKDDDYRYSFLFGHFVTLTNLSPRDWDRIIEQHLSPLYISVHATDLEVRRQCLRNPTAPDIMLQLRELADHGFELHTQLVITPGMNDGPHMDRSIRDLATIWPAVRSVSVVPVGLTRHHKYGLQANTHDQALAVLGACERWERQFRAELGVGFVYPTDEWYLITGRDLPPLEAYDDLALHENGLGMVRGFLDEWAAVRAAELAALQPAVRRITLVTGMLFAPVLARAATELAAATGLEIDVRGIENRGLGEQITVAGLLFGADVIAQLQPLRDSGALGDVVILPRIMFDHPDGICLDDKSPLDIARALDRPVALADLMGDVIDAVQGKNRLIFTPGISPDAIPVVRDGGWAVEKYL